jgi:cation transport protein ChaC
LRSGLFAPTLAPDEERPPMTDQDPFRHHPRLRDRIADPLASRFRHLTTAAVREQIRAVGLSDAWLHSEAEREAIREEALSRHPGGDLWVFAYGSLMWDPALRFAEVRRARVADHARRFILRDTNGGRGTDTTPGLMAALDTCPPEDPGCDGLAFRISEAGIAEESRILFQREMIGPAYLPVYVTADLGGTRVTALTFTADHAADLMAPDISRDDQIAYLATGAGFLGTSYDYLVNLAEQLAALGIDDPDIRALRAEVEAVLAAGVDPVLDPRTSPG